MEQKYLHEEYTQDKYYRFQVFKQEHYYEVWVQEKITDEHLGPEWFDYSDIRDYMHTTNSLEKAIEIGRECLNNLSLPNQ